MTPAAVRRIALGYIAGAVAWLLVSNTVLGLLWPGLGGTANADLIRGVAFVVVTGAVLLGLLLKESQSAREGAATRAAGVTALLRHFRDFANKVGDVVLLLDAGGRIVEANKAALSFLGRDRSALIGLSMKDIEVAGDFSARDRPARYESTLITSNRALRRVTMDVLRLQIRGEAFEQIIAHDADQAGPGDAGRGERAWVEAFVDLPFIGIAVTSPGSKRWVRFNDRLCEILGYSRSQLENLAWTEVTHPDDLDADVAQFERVMRGEIDGYVMDKRFIRSDGRTVHATIDVRAIRARDGSVAYFIATVQDISHRKLAELELKREKELLLAIVDNVPVMVVRNRPGGQTWWLNRECETRLGWRNTDLSEVDFIGRISGGRDEETRVRTFFHVANGSWQDFRTVRRDGSVIDVSWTAVRLSDGSSVGIGIDVSDRKAFEHQLGRQRDLYAAISEINSALLRLPSRDEILELACRIAVERGGLTCAWVTELDGDRHIARLVARAGDDGGRLPVSVAGSAHDPEGRFPTQRAAQTGSPAVADPFPGDEPVPAEVASSLEEAGIRALGSFPIRERGSVTALLTVGAAEAGYFEATVFGMLEELTDTVSFALDGQARDRERQSALATLAREEARYRQLFEAHPVPMWVYDVDSLRILAVNDAALDEYGYSREEFLARTIADIRTEAEVERLMQSVRDGVSPEGIRHAGTWEHVRKDGSHLRVEVTSHGIEFEGRDARLVMMQPLGRA